MSDETARIAILEEQLREAKERLALDPHHQIGEVLAILARIERQGKVTANDVSAVWHRVGEAQELAQNAFRAARAVADLALEQHQQVIGAIAALPCNRPHGGGNGACPCSDTERPIPPLHAVEL